MKHSNFPESCNDERVRRVLEHYEKQSDEEAVAEDEAAYESTTHTAMDIPVELVPEVRELLTRSGAHASHGVGVQAKSSRSERARLSRTERRRSGARESE